MLSNEPNTCGFIRNVYIHRRHINEYQTLWMMISTMKCTHSRKLQTSTIKQHKLTIPLTLSLKIFTLQ